MLSLFQEDINHFYQAEGKKLWLTLISTQEGLWALA